MSAILEREHLKTSRALEFFSEKELSMQLGESDESNWPIAIIKELIDNGLDACETAGVLPTIKINTDYENFISVKDNGPGLSESIISQSLDYTLRISDKNFYISPSRGQLGNALKCAWAMPYVLDGEQGKVEVITNGKRYTIQILVDRLAQIPKIDMQKEDVQLISENTKIKEIFRDDIKLSEMPAINLDDELVKNGTKIKLISTELAKLSTGRSSLHFLQVRIEEIA